MGGERRAERPAAARPAPDVRPPTVRRSWREKVRHAVDLTVAFVTLEDAPSEFDDPSGELSPPHASVDRHHAHRKPLRPVPRSRRPGAVTPRAALCTAPVGHVPSAAPKRRTRVQ
jgi:hypothetical protein